MRIGKFYITRHMVVDEYPTVAKVLAEIGFVPTRVEMLFCRDTFEYEGLSRRFEDVSQYTRSPEYRLEIEEIEDGELIVGVEKV